MNCTDCQNQFSDFIDEEISLKMARSLQDHLASCPNCAAELQLFQQTVTTLHSFPVQKVPADFIIGINEKLTPQPFAKLKGWLSFMTQHKLTTTTALAALMVGVISASVLQLSSQNSEQIVAQKLSGETSSLQAMSADHDQNNYYPGIPYLAQNSQTSQLPKPRNRVQFTSTKQSPASAGHNYLFDSRGSPAALANPSTPHPSLTRLGAVSPDLIVTVHPSSTSHQNALIRQLTANRDWTSHISGNTLLVTLPCNQLSTFQHLFGPADPHINPTELSRLSNLSPSSLLTIAVAFH